MYILVLPHTEKLLGIPCRATKILLGICPIPAALLQFPYSTDEALDFISVPLRCFLLLLKRLLQLLDHERLHGRLLGCFVVVDDNVLDASCRWTLMQFRQYQNIENKVIAIRPRPVP